MAGKSGPKNRKVTEEVILIGRERKDGNKIQCKEYNFRFSR